MGDWAAVYGAETSASTKPVDFGVNLEFLSALHLTGVPFSRAKSFVEVFGIGMLSDNCDTKVKAILDDVLLAMAAIGSALFGLSLSLGELIVARVLIGLGFAGGLMAAIKAITLWYPPERWGLITGFHMMAGGLGSMAATLPCCTTWAQSPRPRASWMRRSACIEAR